MKKHILFMLIYTLLITLQNFNSYSQDLIITKLTDTINCKITRIQNEYIYFTFKYENEIRNTLINKNQVSTFKYNYFREPEIPDAFLPSQVEKTQIELLIYGGIGKRTAKLAENLPSNMKGQVYGIDLCYYINSKAGIGIKLSTFYSHNEISDVTFTNNYGNVISGNLSDKIFISYFGPYYGSRIILDPIRQVSINMNFGAGYIGYVDKGETYTNFVIKGNTFGMNVTDKIRINLQVSAYSGVLKKVRLLKNSNYRIIELKEDEYEGLSKIDVNFGLKFLL